jgi:hypothetical protein
MSILRWLFGGRDAATTEWFELGGYQRETGLCSDDDCPCGINATPIPRGQGYLVISEAVVEFRRDARTLQEAKRKAEAMEKAGKYLSRRGLGVVTPILCCGRSPLLRGINKRVAARDAKVWWKTGKVPLRATPRS